MKNVRTDGVDIPTTPSIHSPSSVRHLPMARYDTMQGALPLLVLKILARRGPLHGYAITTQIETMSDNVLRVEQGSLYPALHRMEESGWIKARWMLTDHNAGALYGDRRSRKQLDAEPRGGTVIGAVGHILNTHRPAMSLLSRLLIPSAPQESIATCRRSFFTSRTARDLVQQGLESRIGPCRAVRELGAPLRPLEASR